MTTLESLADELLLDLFEFFDTVHLLRTFHGLNSRFDNLLFNLFQSYRVDFQYTTKDDFNMICDEYLPRIIDQTITLRLSNDDDTPQQIELFLSQDNLLPQFTRLKAFCLHHVLSEEIMETISRELEHLPTLIHFSVIQCCIPGNPEELLTFIDRIWSLPKLMYCNLDIYLEGEIYFMPPTTISSSLEYVSIKGFLFDFDELDLLFERTPSLRSLKAHNNHLTEDVNPVFNGSSLITLNLALITMNEDVAMNLLQNMLYLRHLTVDIYGACVNGYQWEHIIRNDTPNLKIFRLKEQISMIDQSQGDQKMDTLLKSFQSEFWLSERKWFVRCDWNLADTYSSISLYTLPYSFDEFAIGCLLMSKSTSPQDVDWQSYHRVQKLYCNAFSDEDAPSARRHFPSVRHFTTKISIYDRFQSILPRLDQLRTLQISLADIETTLSQWQILLNRATNLHSLTIGASSSSIIMSFILNIQISVRRLNLQVHDHWFDDKQCSIFINSSLGAQCEILAIDVKSCNSVLDLANNMIKLRALKVQCEDDAWDFNSLLSGNDDFVNWLQICLPDTCYITRDLHSLDDIHLWIR